MADARVVVEDVDVVVDGEDRLRELLDRVRVGYVERVRLRGAAAVLDLARHVPRAPLVDVRHVDLRAVARERQRGRTPDPRARARDDRDPAVQIDDARHLTAHSPIAGFSSTAAASASRRDTARVHCAVRRHQKK